jgi:hypothetical protein
LNIPQLATLTDDEPDLETAPAPTPVNAESVIESITEQSQTSQIVTIEYKTAAQQKKIKKGEAWASSAIKRDRKTGQELTDFFNVTIFKGKLHTDPSGRVIGSDDTKTNSSFWAGAYAEALRELKRQDK